MLRSLAPYLAVALVVAALTGYGYGAGAIGVLGVYGLVLVAGLVSLVGYVRWDERHHA
jgi:hypothetical protein